MSSSSLNGIKTETPKNLLHICSDYIDTEREENYRFNYFINQYDVSKYQHYHFITCANNTYYTALLFEIPSKGKLFILVLLNIYNIKGENITYKKYRSIKLDKNYIEAISIEDKANNDIDSQDFKRKIKKKHRGLHFACETFLLLEIDRKKIILIDFNEKKYTTLFTSSSMKKFIHIVFTFDELLRIEDEYEGSKPSETKTPNKPKSKGEGEYLTRTYVFCVSEGQLFFFLLNKYVLYHLKFVLYSFPFEELKVNIEHILIQRCLNSKNCSQWFYLIVILQDGKMTRYITEYTSKCFKNYLLEFRDIFNKGKIKKISTIIDKATYTHIQLIIFHNQQSYIMLQIDRHVYLLPFMLDYTPNEMRDKFIGYCNSNNDNSPSNNTSRVSLSNISSPFVQKGKDDLNNFSEKTPIKDKPNLFIDQKDVLTYLLPCKTDYNKVVISMTSKNLCCFINNCLYIFHHHSNEERLNDTTSNINMKYFFQHCFASNIFVYAFIQYPLMNYSMLLTNTTIFKLRYNESLNNLLTKLIKQSKCISNERGNVYNCLTNVFANTLYKEQPVPKCNVCSLSSASSSLTSSFALSSIEKKELIQCKQCNVVKYCSMNHLVNDYSNYHFFECELIQLMMRIENKQNETNQIIINEFIIAVNKILNHLFHFIQSSIDYHFYIIYLQLIILIIKISKIELYICAMLEMKIDKHNSFKLCNKIFNLELIFVYDKIQLLLINFAKKANLTELAIQLFNSSKFIFLLTKKQETNKTATLFNAFGFMNDCSCVKMINKEYDIKTYFSNFFFDINKYINNSRNQLCIYEMFFKHYLYSNASLLKIALYFNTLTKEKINNEVIIFQITQLLSNIASLFEERYSNHNEIPSNISMINTNGSPTVTKESSFMIAYVYFALSFSIIKIGKFLTGIKLLKEISTILEEKESLNANANNDKNIDLNNQFKGKIYFNLGLLHTFIGDYNIGIHYFERSLKISFENSISFKHTMKIYYSLILSYININKPETAFCLIKEALELAKKSNYYQYSFDKFLKLKIYLIYILDLTDYQYNAMQAADKKNNKHFVTSKERSNRGQSDKLLNYILNNQPETTLKEISGKYNPMFLRVLEFFSQLSPRLLDKLNEDNKLVKASSLIKDDNNNNNDRSVILTSRDTSMNISSNIININKEGHSLKDDNDCLDYEDEIEIKINVYDELNPNQKKELSNLDNKLFLRSNILRDPKGAIDKFNLNYHLIYTYDYFAFLNKLSENYLLKKINSYGIVNNSDKRFFDYKPGYYLSGLKNFCAMDRIKSIIYNEYTMKNESIDGFKTPAKKQEQMTNECHEWINAINNRLMQKQISIGYLDDAFKQIFYILNPQERDFILDNPEKIFNFIYADIHHKVIGSFSNEESVNKSNAKSINEDNEQRIPSILSSFEIGIGKQKGLSTFFLKKTAEKGKNSINSIKGTMISADNNIKFFASEDNNQNDKEENKTSVHNKGQENNSQDKDQSTIKQLTNIQEEPIKLELEKSDGGIMKKQKQVIDDNSKSALINKRGSKLNNKKIDIEYSQIITKENNSPFISDNFTDELPLANGVIKTKGSKEDNNNKQYDTKDDKVGLNKYVLPKNKTDTEFLEEMIKKEMEKKKEHNEIFTIKQTIVKQNSLNKTQKQIENKIKKREKPKVNYRNRSHSKIPIDSSLTSRDLMGNEHNVIISALLKRENNNTKELKEKDDNRKRYNNKEDKDEIGKVTESFIIIDNTKLNQKDQTRNLYDNNNNSSLMSLDNKQKQTIQWRKPPTYQQLKQRILRKSASQFNL